MKIDRIFKIFDNGGKTWDRYTLLTEAWHFGKGCDAFAFSSNCDTPQGFNQYIGDVYQEADLGKEVSFGDLPENVQQCILDRLQ